MLAKANRGILYVDEVNLLDDHLVDVLLDSAASGETPCNVLQRFRADLLMPLIQSTSQNSQLQVSKYVHYMHGMVQQLDYRLCGSCLVQHSLGMQC